MLIKWYDYRSLNLCKRCKFSVAFVPILSDHSFCELPLSFIPSISLIEAHPSHLCGRKRNHCRQSKVSTARPIYTFREHTFSPRAAVPNHSQLSLPYTRDRARAGTQLPMTETSAKLMGPSMVCFYGVSQLSTAWVLYQFLRIYIQIAVSFPQCPSPKTRLAWCYAPSRPFAASRNWSLSSTACPKELEYILISGMYIFKSTFDEFRGQF